ncbi:hypothetical protein ACF0H5_022089 [Mactra antiquata]
MIISALVHHQVLALYLEEVLSTTVAFFASVVPCCGGHSEVTEEFLEVPGPVGEVFSSPVDAGWSTVTGDGSLSSLGSLSEENAVICEQPLGLFADVGEFSLLDFSVQDESFSDVSEQSFGFGGPLVSTPRLLLCEDSFPVGDDDVFLEFEETAAFSPCMSFDSLHSVSVCDSQIGIEEPNDSYTWEDEISLDVSESRTESLLWDSLDVSLRSDLMDSSDEQVDDSCLETYALPSPTNIMSPGRSELASFSFESPVSTILAAGFNGYHYRLHYNGYFLHLPLEFT